MSIYHIVKQSDVLVSWMTDECVAGKAVDVLALIFFSIHVNLYLVEVVWLCRATWATKTCYIYISHYDAILWVANKPCSLGNGPIKLFI